MTRKEIIIKAWMDLGINLPSGICSESGWFTGYFCNGVDDILDEYGILLDIDKIEYDIDHDGIGKFRPKSLQGIENNNGWIVFEKGMDLSFLLENFKFIWIKTITNDVTCIPKYKIPQWNNFITHFIPIIEPDLPLY